MKSSANVLCEPVAKNTCPAITSSGCNKNKDPSGIMLVMPSDHIIVDEKPLKKAIDRAMPLAQAEEISNIRNRA